MRGREWPRLRKKVIEPFYVGRSARMTAEYLEKEHMMDIKMEGIPVVKAVKAGRISNPFERDRLDKCCRRIPSLTRR